MVLRMLVMMMIIIIMMMMLIMMMTVQIKQVVSETTMMHFHMLDVQKYCFAIAASLFSIHIMDIFTTAAKQS